MEGENEVDQAIMESKTGDRVNRHRKLTEKGLKYRLELKVNNFFARKAELCKEMKSTLKLRGQCEDVSKWKQELSKAQIIQLDLADIYGSIAQLGGDEGVQNVKEVWNQVSSEWNNFQGVVEAEIRYVEQLYLERAKSVCGSKASRSSRKSKSSLSSNRTGLSHKDKFELQKREATLKVDLAFLQDEQRLDREKLRQEQEARDLKLQKELAQNQAQLKVCLEGERLESELADQESIISALPKESHADSMERYFNSLPFAHTPGEPARSGQLQPPLVPYPVVVTSLADHVTTVHATTQPHTTTTVSTPLISPAHYAVLNSQGNVESKHNLAPEMNGHFVTRSLADNHCASNALSTSGPLAAAVTSGHHHSTPASTSQHVRMSSGISPIISSAPALNHKWRHSPDREDKSTGYAQYTLSEMNPRASVFEPKTTRNALPVVHEYLTSTSHHVGHQRPPQVPPESTSNSAEWQRVAVSLEKCMSKLVETNDKLITSIRPSEKTTSSPSSRVKVTIPIFSGDPLQYPIWHSAFKAHVDGKDWGADTKLNLLNQYVSGGPKQVVEHYLLIGTEDAYVKAKSVLHERYGNPNVVSSAFLSKLEKWPKIAPRDAGGLRELSDFLDKVVAARENIQSLAILDFAKEKVKLIAKLPYHAESKWREVITNWRLTNGESSYPTFLKFAEFVRGVADRANIPELEDLSKLTSKPKLVRGTGAQALATTATSNREPRREPTDQVNKFEKNLRKEPVEKEDVKACLYCDRSHHLNDCKGFQEKHFSARKNFFFKRKLCLGCALSNHQIKDCKNPPTCKKCGGAHLTCLHQEEGRKETGDVKCTSVCGIKHQYGTDNSMIVPVWVRPEGDSSREILQYAVLDDQSNVSFISQDLCDHLDLRGTATTLRLTTMQDSNVPIETNRISGVEVLDYNREHVIKLPILYSRESMPADPKQIPKPEVAREWRHLELIAKDLIPHQPSAEISLLIGNNCPRAIRP